MAIKKRKSTKKAAVKTVADQAITFNWGVIIAGAFVATAISVVLTQFGSLVGLSVDAPLRGEGDIAAWGVIAAGIWMLWIQLLASLSGGYMAGYMRSPSVGMNDYEVETRDGIHGLTVWAVSTVVVFAGASLAGMIASYINIDTSALDEGLTNAEKNSVVIYGLITGAVSLMSAVAAWWAATMGGEHRDKRIDFSEELSFK